MNIYRIALFVIVWIASWTSSIAQNKITTSFPHNVDIEYRGLLGILNTCQESATIHYPGDEYKYYELYMTVNRDGDCRKTFMGFVNISQDSTTICFTAMAEDSTSCKIYITPTMRPVCKVEIPTEQCLLIECVNEDGYEIGDTIPLMAYSQGIYKQINMGNGKIVNGYDICGLRYSKVHPARWHDTFNIPDYIYFEAVPVKEINYGKFM